VHSDTSCCLTAGVCALINGVTLFNSLAASEIALFPVFRLFLGAERQKTEQKSVKKRLNTEVRRKRIFFIILIMSKIKTPCFCASVFQIVSRQEKSGKKAGIHAVVLVKIFGRNQQIGRVGDKLKAGI
jgi:hypothetical protein